MKIRLVDNEKNGNFQGKVTKVGCFCVNSTWNDDQSSCQVETEGNQELKTKTRYLDN